MAVKKAEGKRGRKGSFRFKKFKIFQRLQIENVWHRMQKNVHKVQINWLNSKKFDGMRRQGMTCSFIPHAPASRTIHAWVHTCRTTYVKQMADVRKKDDETMPSTAASS
eukprot:1161986-Pelagomonas_calceolata.AAC.4